MHVINLITRKRELAVVTHDASRYLIIPQFNMAKYTNELLQPPSYETPASRLGSYLYLAGKMTSPYRIESLRPTTLSIPLRFQRANKSIIHSNLQPYTL